MFSWGGCPRGGSGSDLSPLPSLPPAVTLVDPEGRVLSVVVLYDCLTAASHGMWERGALGKSGSSTGGWAEALKLGHFQNEEGPRKV